MTHGEVTVALKTAYETAEGALQVTYEMTHKSPVKASVILNGFYDADGHPVKFAALIPPRLVSANGTVATGVVVVVYSDPPTSPDQVLKKSATLRVEFDDQTTARLALT